MRGLKIDRFDLAVWSVLAGLGLALAGVILAGDRVGARIVRTFPEDGGEIGAYGRVGVEFAQPMQPEVRDGLLVIEPTTPGELRWEERRLWFIPAEPFQRGVRYTARLGPGVASRDGRQVKQGARWGFGVRAPWVAYVSFAEGQRRLWRIPSAGGQAEPLTDVEAEVYDFAVAPGGEQIVYSAANDQRGIDLWLTTRAGQAARLLVDCGPDLCTSPAWSPAADLIAYSREPAGITPDAPNGPPRVWTVEPATGQTVPLYEDSQVLGYGPSWSPDGRWLASFDGSVTGIRILDVRTRAEVVLNSFMATVGAWSPDGNEMLFNELNLESAPPYVTVYRVDLSTQARTAILGADPNQADYSTPAWSPTGEWVVVGLRLPDGGTGKQLWLMRPDGSEGRLITDDPAFSHYGYQWDPWGQSLVLQRVELNKPFARPQVLVWTMATGELRWLAEDVFTPVWLP